MTTEHEWEAEFGLTGGIWRHDGNPKRPNVRTTSQKISNGCFNGDRILADGHLFGLACKALWRMASSHGITGENLRIVGAAMGGISLSSRIAEAGMCRSAYAEKSGDGLVFNRFILSPHEKFLLAEDTITTGGTLVKLREAVAVACSANPTFAGAILALCNRSGKSELDGVPIFSLVSLSFDEWEEGSNPFTEDGKELVPPISEPKLNWHEVTRDYS